ncbi:hypothetical protein [Sphingorhabdus sp.]|uniref:hypothetical protein n=1 Tax=Sphingorhabdus sp. TaxID=1902408 RepID=UPI003983C267
MAKHQKPASDARLNAKIRRQFLDHLAATANVSASARTAGVAGSAVYAERRRSAAFRGDWALALAEGYARLEIDLLAEALQVASPRTGDATLKARAQIGADKKGYVLGDHSISGASPERWARGCNSGGDLASRPRRCRRQSGREHGRKLLACG